MNKKNRLTVSIIVAIILLACACPATSLPVINEQPATSIPALPTQPEIPTAIPQSINVLFSDDFSVESSELETFSDESGSAETKDGAYVVRSTGELMELGTLRF